MADPKEPSRKYYAEHYPTVMQRAGLTKGADSEREFDIAIYTIFNGYWDARDQLTIAGYQEVLAKYVRAQAIVREALRSLDPIYSEINFAARLQDVPEREREDEIAKYLSIRGRVDRRKWDGSASNRDLDFMMAQRDLGIHFLKNNPDLLARLLRRQPGDYRRDRETALVIEPALDLLEQIGFKPSRKLTRKAFFDALFDLIGIDKKRRPNSRSIDVIVGARRART